MDNSSSALVHSRLREVLQRLGNREPSTTVEANAVIENIRNLKGHLDEKTRAEIDTLSAHGQETILCMYADA
jgi:hypothetical protein